MTVDIEGRMSRELFWRNEIEMILDKLVVNMGTHCI